MRVPNFRRVTVVLALAAFLPVTTTACFGKFQLIRNVYKFNKEISPDKWVQWLAFLVMSVVPVYGFAGLIDALFANSVEFWTGDNPVMAGTTKTVYGDNGEVASATFNADGTADLVLTDAQGTVRTMTVVREGDTLVARDADGSLLARVGEVNGQAARID